MTNSKSTAPIDSAAMIRAYCPEWCESEAAGRHTPHTMSALGDGTRIVVHRGHHDSTPGSTTGVVLLREVRWTQDGNLVQKSDTILLGETIFTSQTELTEFADLLRTLGQTMKLADGTQAALK